MRLSSVLTRERVAVVCLVVLVAVAGCSGLGGSGDADGNESANNSTALAEFGSDIDSEVTPASELDVSEEEVRSDATDALAAVDTYQMSSELTINTSQNNVQQSRTLTSEAVVDRDREVYQVEQTVNLGSRSVTTDIYLVDGTLYQRNELFANQYGSEWIQLDVSDNSTQRFRAQDEIGFHEQLIENGTVTLVGRQAVDGEEAYRLRIESDESAYSDYLSLNTGESGEVNLTVVAWVSADSGRLLRSEGRIDTTADIQGSSVQTTVRYSETFDYGEASVTLPDEASTAVDVENATAN